MPEAIWTRPDFSRRRYLVEGEQLDKAKLIEVIVMIDGKQFSRVQAREPGIVAVVSKPRDQGFEIDMVEPSRGRFVDRAAPTELEEVQAWHFAALGM